MITTLDFIRRPFTPDLTQAGVAYACQWLARSDEQTNTQVERLLLQISSIAADLALRRLLADLQIPYQTINASPVTEPGRTDIVVGGRRLALLCLPVFHPNQIRVLQEDPAVLLDRRLPAPSELLRHSSLEPHDLYVYTFVAAQLRLRQDEISETVSAGQPVRLLAFPPSNWRHPPVWRALGEIDFRAEKDEALPVEIGGLGEKHQFTSQTIQLASGHTTSVTQSFWTLAYLSSSMLPHGRIAARVRISPKTHLFHPKSWHNIWLYGEEIVFAGYISRREQQRRSKSQPKTQGWLETRGLRPITELLNAVRDWENR